MLRVVIIDDEATSIRTLEALLKRYAPELKVVATATVPETGLQLIEEHQPDVLFLDVSMPRIDGFQLLERVSFRSFALVFTTAHAEFALKAIKNKAYDYLLKPFDVDELKSCVANLVHSNVQHDDRVSQTLPAVIEISMKNGIVLIRPKEIIRLEAAGSYTYFHLDNGVRHMASKNLKEFETQLDSHLFFRCHPAHLINLQKVTRIYSEDGLFVQMSDGSRADVLRKHKPLLLEKLKQGL